MESFQSLGIGWGTPGTSKVVWEHTWTKGQSKPNMPGVALRD